MKINTGTFLNSTSLLDNSFFEKAVIVITEYNKKAAMGFVVNKLFPRTFNELAEFKQSIAFPLYDGGPVGREHLFFVHQRPDLIEDSIHIANSVYLGGDFRKAVMCINNKTITGNDIKLFIGYCGWDYKQLEDEIEEGSWSVISKTQGNEYLYNSNTV